MNDASVPRADEERESVLPAPPSSVLRAPKHDRAVSSRMIVLAMLLTSACGAPLRSAPNEQAASATAALAPAHPSTALECTTLEVAPETLRELEETAEESSLLTTIGFIDDEGGGETRLEVVARRADGSVARCGLPIPDEIIFNHLVLEPAPLVCTAAPLSFAVLSANHDPTTVSGEVERELVLLIVFDDQLALRALLPIRIVDNVMVEAGDRSLREVRTTRDAYLRIDSRVFRAAPLGDEIVEPGEEIVATALDATLRAQLERLGDDSGVIVSQWHARCTFGDGRTVEGDACVGSPLWQGAWEPLRDPERAWRIEAH